MNMKLLLAQVTSISNRYESIYQKTGGRFNIFDIANISADEVTVCRVIAEFLDPQGSHYQGDSCLRLFLQHVLDIDPDTLD